MLIINIYNKAFNRTTVECKQEYSVNLNHRIFPFNRTTVECKYVSSLVIPDNAGMPLIELQQNVNLSNMSAILVSG